MGAIIAPAIVPTIAYTLDWHWAFIFAGIAGIGMDCRLWPFFEYSEKSRRISAGEPAYIESDAPDLFDGGGKVTRGTILRHRHAWSFMIAKFLSDPI